MVVLEKDSLLFQYFVLFNVSSLQTSVHSISEKFENAALFLRLGLLSTLNQSVKKNEAFQKRSSNRRNL